MSSNVEIKLNWLDRMVGFFSPKALLKRKRAKLYNSWIERKYEAAAAGRRTSGWCATNGSANAEISTALSKVRDRARDLVRNNPYASRGVQVITNNVVGRGIKTQIKVDDNRRTNRREERLNRVWRAWSDTPACDYEGIHNFNGLQRLVMRSVAESGEVFVRIRRTSRRQVLGPDGQLTEVPPIQLQILESDFVSSTRRSGVLPNGNQIIQGVEIDETGRKVAYHVYLAHPGGNDLSPASRFTTTRVPAEEMLHLYRVDRPGALRGISWLSPIALRLRDFDLYEDAQLKRQQCAAMFTAFIHDLEGVDDAAETEEEMELGEKMEPGLMEILPPGKSITLSNPPGADNYGEYTSVVLHSIASGFGITYEQLTGNLSEVNFSSARMGFLESQRNFDTWRSNIMMNQFLNPVFRWFLIGAELIGERTQDARAVFTPPRREMIDPVKETQALKLAVRSGFKTQSEVVRELGNDPDLHYSEIQSDNALLDEKSIILDTDPRNTNSSGALNEGDSQDDESDQ